MQRACRQIKQAVMVNVEGHSRLVAFAWDPQVENELQWSAVVSLSRYLEGVAA